MLPVPIPLILKKRWIVPLVAEGEQKPLVQTGCDALSTDELPVAVHMHLSHRCGQLSLRIVSPHRCVLNRYSRVSSKKHRTGRSPFLPRCLALCPLRAPSIAPYTVATVVSILTVTRRGAYAHNAQTLARKAAPSYSSEADCTIHSEVRYRQNVLTVVNRPTRSTPQTIASVRT